MNVTPYKINKNKNNMIAATISEGQRDIHDIIAALTVAILPFLYVTVL